MSLLSGLLGLWVLANHDIEFNDVLFYFFAHTLRVRKSDSHKGTEESPDKYQIIQPAPRTGSLGTCGEGEAQGSVHVNGDSFHAAHLFCRLLGCWLVLCSALLVALC